MDRFGLKVRKASRKWLRSIEVVEEYIGHRASGDTGV